MLEPSVVVVIPAYNAARFVRSSLDSLRAQTFRSFETVVVDDGSGDQTSEVVGGYPEVRLIRQENAGVAAARNRGIRETHPKWVAFLDADDLWMPEKLSLQLECARKTGAGAIFCDLQMIDIEGRDMCQPPGPGVSLEMEPLLLHSAAIPQGTSSTLLVRRSLLESVGAYDESLATMADWDLLIRLRQATTFGHVPRRLAAYRRYPGTMSRSVAMLERESLLILDKVFGKKDLPDSWRHLEAKSRAWNDLVLAGSYLESGQTHVAFRFALRALKRNPKLVGRVLGMPIRRMRKLRTNSR